MNKIQGKKAKKVKRTAKAATRKTKKVLAKKTGKIKAKATKFLGSAKKKLKSLKRTSADKVHVAEEEISHYVKENPIKSLSVVALTGLIAGYLSRSKK